MKKILAVLFLGLASIAFAGEITDGVIKEIPSVKTLQDSSRLNAIRCADEHKAWVITVCVRCMREASARGKYSATVDVVFYDDNDLAYAIAVFEKAGYRCECLEKSRKPLTIYWDEKK